MHIYSVKFGEFCFKEIIPRHFIISVLILESLNDALKLNKTTIHLKVV